MRYSLAISPKKDDYYLNETQLLRITTFLR
ncbi:hypothetical protein VPH1254_0067 [Vibrio phage 1254]